ncbi:uncharacterized protein LOC101861219 [Aplysia californica]|uniref:Uncharacterized protein LOC101861219 n=1 Tax=Aplysia californica TaxID=6500 RepID=A0ABM1A4X3_APLCA|nr:uncharacterized protein LOC101861219 [Aplysia californica]
MLHPGAATPSMHGMGVPPHLPTVLPPHMTDLRPPDSAVAAAAMLNAPSAPSRHCSNCQLDPNPGGPCVPGWGVEGVPGSIKTADGLMVPYPVQEESLEDLNSRKKEIICHMQEEPMFMGYTGVAYRADGFRGGLDGLKTVLGNNKRMREAMPKLVSDMFVATRSTQSLDELLNEDTLSLVKWSSGDEPPRDVCTRGDFPERAPVARSVPESGRPLNAAPFSPAEGTVEHAAGGRKLYSSLEASSDQLYRPHFSHDAFTESEFSQFPGDDGDENFIPLEHTSVSKFGPISRMAKAKTDNVAPVQVTADSCKKMTPVLAVTPLERPLSSSTQRPSRFNRLNVLDAEPSVKPTPSEKPSIWQQSPCPSYQNIAMLKAGAAEAVTNNERLAYELQAVELEISMKTGKMPEPVGKIIQESVMYSPSRSSPDYPRSSSTALMAPLAYDRGQNVNSLMGRGHVTECFSLMSSAESLVSPQKAAESVLEDFYRSRHNVQK